MKQLIHFFSLVNFALCKGGRGGGSIGGGPGGDIRDISPETIMGFMLICFCGILTGFGGYCLVKIGKILEERKNKAERERALRE